VVLVGLNIGDKILGGREKLSGSSRLGKLVAVLFTVNFVCLSFVVFRTESLSDAGLMFRSLLGGGGSGAISRWSGGVMNAALVIGELRDATHVALVPAEGLGEESIDDGQARPQVMHATTQCDDVGVVVLAGKSGGLDRPGQGGAHPVNLVGGDLLPVATAPEDDAQAPGVGHDRLPAGQAEGGVVVLRVVGVGSVVNDDVPLLPQVFDHGALELEAGVVGGDMDAHGQNCASREQRLAP